MILNDKKIEKEMTRIGDHYGYAYADLLQEVLENCKENDGEK